MTRYIHSFFQHMPPYSGAAALRGHSVVSGLALLRDQTRDAVRVFTTTRAASRIPGAEVVSIDVPEVENSEGLVARMIGEIRMGLAAARVMFGASRCDLAIISTPGYLTALIITARARRKRIPYVVELRDVYPQVYAEAGLLRRGSLPYRFFAKRSRRMYEGARLVIAATRGLAREVTQESPQARVAHVYNGFPSSLRSRKATKHRRFTVCFHGTMGFFQDIETLLRVAERLAPYDIEMVVIGYGRKEGLLQEARLQNLHFLGRLSFERTIEEVERCHLGLCLRLDDGISKDAFPVKIWEYLGLGIPSIVTPPCEAGDFLEAEGCGLQLPAGNVESLVETVLRLKQEEGLLQAMSHRCTLVGEQYTRERTGLVAAQLIGEVLARSHSCQETTARSAG